MTLVKFNRPLRETLFPAFHANFYGNVLNDLLDRPMDRLWGGNTVPPVNIVETDNAYEIQLASPGHKKEDFTIELENDVLTISFQEKEIEHQETKKITRKEFNFTSFKRSFTLPELTNLESIHAEYQDGILLVRVAKKEVDRTPVRKIEVV